VTAEAIFILRGFSPSDFRHGRFSPETIFLHLIFLFGDFHLCDFTNAILLVAIFHTKKAPPPFFGWSGLICFLQLDLLEDFQHVLGSVVMFLAINVEHDFLEASRPLADFVQLGHVYHE
jgi:hypothetical protein